MDGCVSLQMIVEVMYLNAHNCGWMFVNAHNCGLSRVNVDDYG